MTSWVCIDTQKTTRLAKKLCQLLKDPKEFVEIKTYSDLKSKAELGIHHTHLDITIDKSFSMLRMAIS